MKQALTKFLNQPRILRHIFNWYRPYRGAGIKVTQLANDFSSATVQMKLTWFNRNYVGVHFGGSLYAMIDPFYMLLIMNQLGRDYIVWDKAAEIEFIRPGEGTVSAHFNVDQHILDDIRAHTANGEKYLPTYEVDIIDTKGQVVAKAFKTIYIRRKKSAI
jgi:acyl-coenzyme A thioesterase PaaI-like protein